MTNTSKNYRFQLQGAISMAPWSLDRNLRDDDAAIETCKQLMESFEGARAVYAVVCFKMTNLEGGGVDGSVVCTARAKPFETEVRLPLAKK